MTPKKLVSALATIGFGVGLAVSAGPASAEVRIFSPITAFEDTSLHFVVDNNGNGLIDTGDRLISVLKFGNTQGIVAGQGPTAITGEEITGVADLTIATVSADGTLVFAPSGAAGVLSGFAAGTMVALWRDPSNDLDVINANCGSRASCIFQAGLGETVPLYLTAGSSATEIASGPAFPALVAASLRGCKAQARPRLSLPPTSRFRPALTTRGSPWVCSRAAAAGSETAWSKLRARQPSSAVQGLVPAQWTARGDTDFQISPLAGQRRPPAALIDR